MKRNFILPSEEYNYVQHDCRPISLKYRSRSSLYDVSVLSSLLNKTKNSLNLIYNSYLSQPSDLNKINKPILVNTEEAKDNNTIITNTTSTKTEEEGLNTNKIIKEIRVNRNDPIYGNLIWPCSILTTYNEDILICDTYEHRILIFNKELIFKYKIGSKGSHNSEFNEPSDMVLNEIGKLYVADKNNYRIQIFSESKKFREIKQKGASALKTGTEFVYSKQIELNDKPIKLSSAPIAPVLAVCTETGFIYILNENNQIINFLKLKNISYIKNICLSDTGTELICLKSDFYLKFYKIDLESSQPNTETRIKKLELSRKIKLEKNYLPGICLSKTNTIRLSLDLQNLLIFDMVNLNLLEFSLNGKFNKIILKAENYLSNLLAFDYSGDRQHLVVVEAELNRKTSLIESKILSQDEHLIKQRSKNFCFKLKVYKYRECECHRTARAKSRFTMLNRSLGFNQFSFNNFSLESDSTEFNII